MVFLVIYLYCILVFVGKLGGVSKDDNDDDGDDDVSKDDDDDDK